MQSTKVKSTCNWTRRAHKSMFAGITALRHTKASCTSNSLASNSDEVLRSGTLTAESRNLLCPSLDSGLRTLDSALLHEAVAAAAKLSSIMLVQCSLSLLCRAGLLCSLVSGFVFWALHDNRGALQHTCHADKERRKDKERQAARKDSKGKDSKGKEETAREKQKKGQWRQEARQAIEARRLPLAQASPPPCTRQDSLGSLGDLGTRR